MAVFYGTKLKQVFQFLAQIFKLQQILKIVVENGTVPIFF
jgi:hypothetical protein